MGRYKSERDWKRVLHNLEPSIAAENESAEVDLVRAFTVGSEEPPELTTARTCALLVGESLDNADVGDGRIGIGPNGIYWIMLKTNAESRPHRADAPFSPVKGCIPWPELHSIDNDRGAVTFRFQSSDRDSYAENKFEMMLRAIFYYDVKEADRMFRIATQLREGSLPAR